MFRIIEATWIGINESVPYAIKADTVEAAREIFRNHMDIWGDSDLEGFGPTGVVLAELPAGSLPTDTPELFLI